MFRKPVVVKNGKHQGLVECVSIGKILELERFVEEGIKSFSVNFRLELFYPFCLGHQENLERRGSFNLNHCPLLLSQTTFYKADNICQPKGNKYNWTLT